MKADILIVGGGIVGLATAHKLSLRYPDLKILLLEKESKLAEHQTGRNSGVIHSGLYYKPGSLKATTCRDGKEQLERFCAEHGVAYDICGKVVVALDESEIPALERIFERGKANGVKCERITAEQLREYEPHVAGIDALHVAETGIVDYVGFCERIADDLRRRGHQIVLNAKVTQVQERAESIVASTTVGDAEAKYLVNCAGLHSDWVARQSGLKPKAKIVPFRGEYYELTPETHHLCRNLIYPVPDPSFPFLGVHFTRMIGGGVECGPNAVLAFAREGYHKTTVNVPELVETLTYSGFQRMAKKHLKMGMGEMHRSFSKAAFVKALQRLIPEIKAEHLTPIDAGVRAQAVLPDGTLVDDFSFEGTPRALHVVNAPSPAATAALAIGDHIVNSLEERF
jgi:L-2-hydroxyglutarate oxidase